MSTIFHLVVPKDEQTREVVTAYYELVAEKEAQIDSEMTRLTHIREQTVETFETENTVDIYEYPSILNSTRGDGWRNVYDVLDPTPDGAYIAKTEEQVRNLIRVFRQVKQNLLAKAPLDIGGITYTAEDIEFGAETQVIALCEFALSQGYAIGLDH